MIKYIQLELTFTDWSFIIMLELIIVEDEEMLLNNLSKIVNYSDYGFNLTHLFSNGEEAINYIKNNKIDLIISDIRMPKATGLDIAKYVYENNLNAKVVILSGYSEFEYAQASIRYNVFDFISKPFRKSEYISMLKKAYTEIVNMSSKNLNSPYETDAFFRGLCYGSQTDEQSIKSEIKRLDLDIDIYSNLCMYFTLDITNPEVYLSKSTHIIDNLTNIASNILILTNVPVKYCSVINFTSAHIEYFLVFESSVANTNIKKNIKEQITSYMKSLGLNVIIKNQILFNNIIQVISQRVISLKELMKIYEQSFIDSLGSEDWNKIKSSCENVFQTISKFAPEEYDEKLNTFINKINPILKMYWNKEVDISKINELKNKEKIEYAKQIVSNSISSCYNKSSLIDNITSYIKSNYAKQITLDDVAKHSYISKIYLCQYIKKHTKMTFNEYITHVRIEKSKELLISTNLKIYQICEMIGYKTTAHFIKIFKANTGLTPSDFKKQNTKNGKLK